MTATLESKQNTSGSKVFTSCPRADSAGHSGRLGEQLRGRFGSDADFQDVDGRRRPKRAALALAGATLVAVSVATLNLLLLSNDPDALELAPAPLAHYADHNNRP